MMLLSTPIMQMLDWGCFWLMPPSWSSLKEQSSWAPSLLSSTTLSAWSVESWCSVRSSPCREGRGNLSRKWSTPYSTMDRETLALLLSGMQDYDYTMHCKTSQLLYTSSRMPLLFGSISGGRFFAIVFFFSLSLAGLSSLIAIMEFPIHVLNDFGSELI